MLVAQPQFRGRLPPRQQRHPETPVNGFEAESTSTTETENTDALDGSRLITCTNQNTCAPPQGKLGAIDSSKEASKQTDRLAELRGPLRHIPWQPKSSVYTSPHFGPVNEAAFRFQPVARRDAIYATRGAAAVLEMTREIPESGCVDPFL